MEENLHKEVCVDPMTVHVLFKQNEVIIGKLDKLHDIIYSGPSALLPRLAVAEKSVENNLQRLNNLEKTHNSGKIEENKSRWQLYTAIIMSVIAFITTVINKLVDVDILSVFKQRG